MLNFNLERTEVDNNWLKAVKLQRKVDRGDKEAKQLLEQMRKSKLINYTLKGKD